MVEVTTRTLQGRHLLRPSPEVNQTILGVLGRAQRRTEMGICAFNFLSNHYHILLRPESALQLSEFMGFVNGNIARKVGRLHDWRDRMWSRRYQHIIVSDEPEAQIARLKYVLAQGVKEGLVAKPEDWPGAHCVGQLVSGNPQIYGGVWRDQTAEYNARRAGKVLQPEEFLFREVFELRPLLCFEGASWSERRDHARALVKEIEHSARQRFRETGKRPLGAKKILLQVPEFRPEHLEHSPAPACHAASIEHYRQLRREYWEFLAAYREASERLKQGLPDPVFPPGSFPPRLPYVPESRAGPQ